MTTSDDDYTRREAAKILGFETIQGVRALERSGRLRGVKDCDGVVRFSPTEVEEVRAEREAAGKPVQSSEEVDKTIRGDVEDEDAEERLDAQVKARNKEKRAAFEASHLDEHAVGLALGIPASERHSRVRELCQAGLVRKVESPKQLVVEGDEERLRIEDGLYPLVAGGPFYAREDVLRLRAEAIIAAAMATHAALPDDQKAMFGELLRTLFPDQ
jgi:hypothetical protein